MYVCEYVLGLRVNRENVLKYKKISLGGGWLKFDSVPSVCIWTIELIKICLGFCPVVNVVHFVQSKSCLDCLLSQQNRYTYYYIVIPAGY